MISIKKLSMSSTPVEGVDVYDFIRVELTNITDNDIGGVWFRFAVNKTWLSDKGINTSNVTLYRWYGNSWVDLKAIKTGEDKNEVVYTVNSPGFSTFAIGAKMNVQSQISSCVQDWSCTKWSDCKDGYQIRSCNDLNSCGSQFKPWEFKDCSIIDNSDPSPISGLMSLNTETKIGVVIVLTSLVLAMIFFRKSEKYNTKSIGILRSE